MAHYFDVLFYSLIGSIISLSIAMLLVSHKTTMSQLTKYATPFAAGALLAAVFIDLLPEGLAEAEPATVCTAALVGILLFFMAERFLRWFHHDHDGDDHHHDHASVALIITGNTMHNLLDGVAIAAAFLINVPTGIVTTIAIAAHEIPHEIGDFGLLLAKKVSLRRTIIINVLIALSTVVAAILTFVIGRNTDLPLGFLIGVSAGFLLYIALSDLIPTIHDDSDNNKLIQLQTVMLLIGVATVGAAIHLAHYFIEK